MIWQMMMALLHSNGQLRTERDGDTEKGCQKPAVQKTTADELMSDNSSRAKVVSRLLQWCCQPQCSSIVLFSTGVYYLAYLYSAFLSLCIDYSQHANWYLHEYFSGLICPRRQNFGRIDLPLIFSSMAEMLPYAFCTCWCNVA